MIPNVIHQIWIQGRDKIPDELQEHYRSCRKINNNFRHILWDETKILDFLNKKYGSKFVELYHFYKVPAQKADFARYAILYIYGGIYLDMDMICKKNLTGFLSNDFFCTDYILLPDLFRRYLNGIIGSKPKHLVFLFIFDNLFQRKLQADDVTYSTGTNLFYDSIQEYLDSTGNNDITIIDKKYLHPCNMYDDENCHKTCLDCYIVHTNYSSWNPQIRLLKTIRKHIKIIIPIVIIIIILLYFILKKYRRL